MRKILLPISLIYHIVLKIRHKLYDWGIFKAKQFDFPVICIGNLCLGGTGKTPTTEYLINLLKGQFHVATLSRGYGRKTKGFVLADESSNYEAIGDEPYQYFRKFNNIQVAVDEDRVDGVQKLINQTNPPEIILLDDAFQHRKIQAGLNILLTDYNCLYSEDFLLPAGTLRDIRSDSKRADIIVVTKAPEKLSGNEFERLKSRLRFTDNQKVFSSYMTYGVLTPLNEKAKSINLNDASCALTLCGIAKPAPFIEEIRNRFSEVKELIFSDHHNFSAGDVEKIVKTFETFGKQNAIIVTTEKDASRLMKNSYLCQFNNLPIFALPIEVRFHQEEAFNSEIDTYVRRNTQNR